MFRIPILISEWILPAFSLVQVFSALQVFLAVLPFWSGTQRISLLSEFILFAASSRFLFPGEEFFGVSA